MQRLSSLPLARSLPRTPGAAADLVAVVPRRDVLLQLLARTRSALWSGFPLRDPMVHTCMSGGRLLRVFVEVKTHLGGTLAQPQPHLFF